MGFLKDIANMADRELAMLHADQIDVTEVLIVMSGYRMKKEQLGNSTLYMFGDDVIMMVKFQENTMWLRILEKYKDSPIVYNYVKWEECLDLLQKAL